MRNDKADLQAAFNCGIDYAIAQTDFINDMWHIDNDSANKEFDEWYKWFCVYRINEKKQARIKYFTKNLTPISAAVIFGGILVTIFLGC